MPSFIKRRAPFCNRKKEYPASFSTISSSNNAQAAHFQDLRPQGSISSLPYQDPFHEICQWFLGLSASSICLTGLQGFHLVFCSQSIKVILGRSLGLCWCELWPQGVSSCHLGVSCLLVSVGLLLLFAMLLPIPQFIAWVCPDDISFLALFN